MKRIFSFFAVPAALPAQSRLTVLIVPVLILLLATGVRLLHWQDLRPQIESGRMRFGMSDIYKADALNLLQGHVGLFIKGPNPPSDADVLTHPPGYSLLLALIFKLFGDSAAAWRFFQILIDGLSAVFIFLIARELLPTAAAIIAGVLVAFSPQLAHTSIVLLPDSPAVLPILLAILLLIRAYRSPSVFLVMAAGALIGVSCWLRPNALLLPVFLGLLILLWFPQRRWLHVAALMAGMFVVIAPITIRNIAVFSNFTPLSLGAGTNLCEGIADYDDQNSFGLFQKDHEITQWEAKFYQRPDYAKSLYAPDGISRDRERVKQCFKIVKEHPLWFASVMVRRIGSMLTYEKAPLVSPLPTVTHSLATAGLSSTWSSTPTEILATGSFSSAPESSNGDAQLLISGNGTENSPIFISRAIHLNAGRDFVLQFPIDMLEGRVTIRVTGESSGTLLGSAAMPDALHRFPGEERTNLLQIPFISTGEPIQISIADTGAGAVKLRLGRMEIFELGQGAFLWTRVPRKALRAVEKFYTTSTMLPLALFGFLLLGISFGVRPLAFILIVPVYYLLAQSPLHTEPRYVVAIHYFLLIPAALTIYWFGLKLWQVANDPLRRRRRTRG